MVITSADPADLAVFKGGMQLTGQGLRFEAVTFDISTTTADFGAEQRAARDAAAALAGATARTNKLQSVIGNLFTQINTKGDVFATSGTRLGNWGFLYGVGCRSNFSQYNDANNGSLGGSFAQAYGGVGSLIGTSNTTPQMATSNFTNYQATTSGPTAGAGGGTYSGTLATVKGLVTDAVLIADLAGTARSLTADTTGAYAAP